MKYRGFRCLFGSCFIRLNEIASRLPLWFRLLFGSCFVLAAAIALEGANLWQMGPRVIAAATADDGKADVVKVYDQQGKLLETRKASYDLLVSTEIWEHGKGWVGVRSEGSLDTEQALYPGVSIEKLSFLMLFPEMKTTTTAVYALGNFITADTGTRTLTGKGTAATSARHLTPSGTTVTYTTSFTISLVSETQNRL